MMEMRPVCVKCGMEMTCAENGVLVYHPLEHATPGPAQERVGGISVVNVDRLIEGSWKDGDIDFVIYGDKYRCPGCGNEVVVDFGGTIMTSQDHMKRLIKKGGGTVIEIRRKTST